MAVTNTLAYVPGRPRAYSAFAGFYGDGSVLEKGELQLSYNSAITNNVVVLVGAPAFTVNISLAASSAPMYLGPAQFTNYFTNMTDASGALISLAGAYMTFVVQAPYVNMPFSSGYCTAAATVAPGTYTFYIEANHPTGATAPNFMEFIASVVITPVFPRLLTNGCASTVSVPTGLTIAGSFSSLTASAQFTISTGSTTNLQAPGVLIRTTAPRTLLIADAVFNSQATVANVSTCSVQLAITDTNSIPDRFDASGASIVNVYTSVQCGVLACITGDVYLVALATLTVPDGEVLEHLESFVSYRTLPLLDGYPLPLAQTFRCANVWTVVPSDYIGGGGAFRHAYITMPGQPYDTAPNTSNFSLALFGAPAFIVTLDLFCNVTASNNSTGYIMSELSMCDAAGLSTPWRVAIDKDQYCGSAYAAGTGCCATTITMTVPAGVWYPIVIQYVITTNPFILDQNQSVSADWFVRAVALPVV